MLVKLMPTLTVAPTMPLLSQATCIAVRALVEAVEAPLQAALHPLPPNLLDPLQLPLPLPQALLLLLRALAALPLVVHALLAMLAPDHKLLSATMVNGFFKLVPAVLCALLVPMVPLSTVTTAMEAPRLATLLHPRSRVWLLMPLTLVFPRPSQPTLKYPTLSILQRTTSSKLRSTSVLKVISLSATLGLSPSQFQRARLPKSLRSAKSLSLVTL